MFLVDWIKVSERGDFRKECETNQKEKIAVEIRKNREIYINISPLVNEEQEKYAKNTVGHV